MDDRTDPSGPAPAHSTCALYHFGDPMCSWCYGFHPGLRDMAAQVADVAPLSLVLGGLRAGHSEPMTERDRAYVRDHWGHVAEASGHWFDCAFFDRESFVYDTAPACQAVVAARLIDPGRALPMMEALSQAFYAHNRDITQGEVLLAVAAETGLEADRFAQVYSSAACREALIADLSLTQQAGLGGFPTLIGRTGERFALLTHGFRPPADLARTVQAWLETAQPAPAASGAAC